MRRFERLIKIALLSAFAVLNLIDMIQTFAFFRTGTSLNPLVVQYPEAWFPLKFALSIGLPLGLYRLDVYVKSRTDGSFLSTLKWFLILTYVSIFFADILYASSVVGNMFILAVLFD